MRKQLKGYSGGEFALSARIYKLKSCEICMKKHNEAQMVLCDRCEDAYHIRCIGLPKVPSDTWICPRCNQDTAHLRLQQMQRRRLNSIEPSGCSDCKSPHAESFEFSEGGRQFEARSTRLVICASCKRSFHSLCFSQRPTAINCTSCEQTIRKGKVPKGHRAFSEFIRQSRNCIAELNYLELTGGFQNLEVGEALAPLQLLPPPPPNDWRLIVSYEASLAYALSTRHMIYCENLVMETTASKIEIIMKAHTNSVEQIYRLHRSDQQVYEQYKAGLEQGRVPAVEVREDRMKGFYLVATGLIEANTIIAQYAGQLITARESLSMVSNDNIFTLIRNPRSCDSLDIAPSRFANIAIFISGINNTQQDAENLENVRALKFAYKGICRLILIANRTIYPHETLYLNYNGDRAICEYPTASFVK